jgi:uncharacterized protein YbjT (DUF2867 family)
VRILITGATGFIGRHLVARLSAAGHTIVCCVRDVRRARRMFPDQEFRACDFNRDVTPDDWLPRIAGVDAVINCAGILQSRRGQAMAAIHRDAPAALFDACARARVRRVVQISALGIGADIGTEYSQTKLEAERRLQALDLDWLILRPSLAYTPAGSFGGTSLFRALAALPWIIPLIGDGKQLFQPIHMVDLAEAVRRLVEERRASRQIIDLVGPEPVAMRDILAALRRWLGFESARCLEIPLPVVNAIARVADGLGGLGPVTSTSLTMLLAGNAADVSPFVAATGFEPRRFADALAAEPAHVQDRWHARLYFLRPLLRVTIGLFFFCTGLFTFLFWPKADSMALLRAAGIPEAVLPLAYYCGWLFDVVLGVALLARWRVQAIGALMAVACVFYLVFVTIAAPTEWIYPITPLGIVIPLMVAMLVMIAIEDDR